MNEDTNNKTQNCIPATTVAKILGTVILFIVSLALLEKFPKSRIVFMLCAIFYLVYLFRQYKKPCDLPIQTLELEELAAQLWLRTEQEEIALKLKQKGVDEFCGEIALDVAFKNTRAQGLWDWLNSGPFSGYISNEYKKAMLEVLSILDQNALLPSVSSNFISDPENDALSKNNTYVILRDVTILDHTANVVLATPEISKKYYSEDSFSIHISALLFASLAHDLGKLRRIISGLADSANHSVYSAEQASEILDKYRIDPKQKKNIVDSILQHHKQIDENQHIYCLILMEVDAEARRQEVQKLTSVPNNGAPSLSESTANYSSGIQPAVDTSWHKKVFADAIVYIWSVFADATANKSRETYFFNGICYFTKEFFEGKIEVFFAEKKLSDFYERKPLGIEADNNISLIMQYVKKQGACITKDEYLFSVIDIQYSSRWRSGVPVYAIKSSFLNNNDGVVKDLVKLSSSYQAIKNIILSKKKESE